MPHTFGLVVGGSTRLGRNCTLLQNVTLGGSFGKKDKHGRSQPWVGDNVTVGVGAVIVGPVRIGSDCIIGANSVVTTDIPEFSVAAGVPAKVIRERWSERSGQAL